MGTNCTPRRRDYLPPFTPEVIVLYKRAAELRETYIACIRDEGCWATNPAEHCPTCREYLQARGSLSRLIDLEVWHDLEVADYDEPPDYLRCNSYQLEEWHKAKRLVLALAEAAGKQ